VSWRDQLQKAKFRDAPFFVTSASGAAGRRTAKHEYPQRDESYVEDMGRKAREFTLDAFVIGADYMVRRDALLTAIETPGPGLLVHPYRGSFKVSVTECRYTESSDRGGMATFQLTFVETSDAALPDTRSDTQAQVSTEVDASHIAVHDEFVKKFKVLGLPAFVGTAALANVNKALDTVRSAILTGIPDMAILPAFTWELAHLTDSIVDLLVLPSDLASRLANQIAALGSVFSPLDAYFSNTQLSHFGANLPVVPQTTPSRVQQSANQQAVVNLVRTASLIEAARASSQMTFSSRNEAMMVRGELTSLLDTAAMTAPDSVYNSLSRLRSAVVRDITARGADMAQVVSYTPRITLPALVISHQLYGDARRTDEIVVRNRIQHPGFVPGGRALEVLL